MAEHTPLNAVIYQKGNTANIAAGDHPTPLPRKTPFRYTTTLCRALHALTPSRLQEYSIVNKSGRRDGVENSPMKRMLLSLQKGMSTPDD